MTRFAIVTTLTLARAPLALAGGATLLLNAFRPSPAALGTGLALLAISSATDALDGALARSWRVTSRFGAMADPLMDKVFFACTLPVATFAALMLEDVPHALSLLALDVLFVLRDQWVSFLRGVGAEAGADVRASLPGKIRTFLAFPAIMFVQLQLGLETLAVREPGFEGIWTAPRAVAIALECLLAALTVWTGIYYTRRYMPALRHAAR